MNEETGLAQVVKELQSLNLSQDLMLDTLDNYNVAMLSSMKNESAAEFPSFFDKLTKELESSNLSQDLILDLLDGYNFTLASPPARENTVEVPNFLDKLVNVAYDLKDQLIQLVKADNVLNRLLKGNKLQEREDLKELLDLLESLRPKEEKKNNIPNKKIGGPLGLFGFLGAAAGFAIGLVKGFLGELFSPLIKMIKNSKIYQRVAGIFTTVGKYVDDIVLKLKGSKVFKAISLGFEKFNSFLNLIKNSKLFSMLSMFRNSPIVRGLSVVGESLKGFFSVIGDVFNGFRRGLAAGTKFGGGIVKILKGFGRFFMAFGKILGWPLTIALGIYGAITGFIDGFKTDGIIGGIKGALVGMFDTIIGGTLDLIKDGVSWISEKLGFSEFSKMLDSFSFTDLYKTYLVDPLFDVAIGIADFISGGAPKIIAEYSLMLLDELKNIFSSAGGAIGDIAGNIGDAISDFNKSILRSALPDPNEELSKANPKYWIRAAVPDSIYEYAYSNVPKKETDKTASAASSSNKLQPNETPSSTESNDRILKAKETRDFSTLTQEEKARAAGYSNWDEYKTANFKWKENIAPSPMITGSTLASAGNISNVSPTIVVNNNSGGNVSNVSTSNVNNNAPAMMPIITGSAMGY